jgi:ABC-type antimicrobial peptide transport system permease subunit
MLKLETGISEVSVRLEDRERTSGVVEAAKRGLPAYDVQSWKELLPMVTAVLELYDFFIFLWFLVAFIAMAFGIVNTMLMAVFERIREFGLLKSLGMKPWWIVEEVLTESFFLLLIAGLAGNALGLASAFALAGPGIDLSAFAAGLEFAGMSRVIYPVVLVRDVILANIVVFLLGLAVSVYPAVKAARFTPVEALAHI